MDQVFLYLSKDFGIHFASLDSFYKYIWIRFLSIDVGICSFSMEQV